jgi:hypothetical protein
VIKIPYASKEKEWLHYLKYYPTHKKKVREWWNKNKDKLNAERRRRYKEDEEWRKHILKRNREYIKHTGRTFGMQMFFKGTGVCLICGSIEFPVLTRHHLFDNTIIHLCGNCHGYFGITKKKIHRKYVLKRIERSKFLWKR